MESLYLTVEAPGGAVTKQGTAWLLWPDRVVTALHVVGHSRGVGQWAGDIRADQEISYRVRIPWEKQGENVVAITPWIFDARTDIAILKLPKEAADRAPDGAFFVLAEERPCPGDPWRAVGFPAFATDAKALALGGVVSYVGRDLANDTIQLFVDQETSAQWGGVSGSAAWGSWGEVIAVIVQTIAGIATCNAAPAEAVARLLRQLPAQQGIIDALAARLGALPPPRLVELANKLEWGLLSNHPDFKADPVHALACRIAQAGEFGVRRALDTLRSFPPDVAALAPSAGDSDDVVGAPPELPDLLAAFIDEDAPVEPTTADLVVVMDALADIGGAGSLPALRARLPAMPDAIFDAAVSMLRARGDLAGPGGGASLQLTARGASLASRSDYVRATLRPLLLAESSTARSLVTGAPLAPSASRRALVYAEVMGLILSPDLLIGPADARRFVLTEAGRSFLTQRTLPSRAPQ